MPYRRFEWHEHVKDVEGEYQATRIAVDRLKAAVLETPDLLKGHNEAQAQYLRAADTNVEGTYLVRLFAAFEAALRSYDQARHNDPTRNEQASVLIDTTGGRRGQGIPFAVRAGAHAVRRVRNYWAHESDATPVPMTIANARAQLQNTCPGSRGMGLMQWGVRGQTETFSGEGRSPRVGRGGEGAAASNGAQRMAGLFPPPPDPPPMARD